MPNFTKQAIKASFLKLLNEQPLAKVTVRSIVEDCGINRNSFYYHYQDIPALIEEIIMESADRLIRAYPRVDSLEECVDTAMRTMLSSKKAILHIFNSVSRDAYEQYLMRCCTYIITTYCETAFADSPMHEEDRELLRHFLTLELFGASLDWVSRGMPEDALRELHRLISLCDGLHEEVIRRSAQSGAR